MEEKIPYITLTRRRYGKFQKIIKFFLALNRSKNCLTSFPCDGCDDRRQFTVRPASAVRLNPAESAASVFDSGIAVSAIAGIVFDGGFFLCAFSINRTVFFRHPDVVTRPCGLKLPSLPAPPPPNRRFHLSLHWFSTRSHFRARPPRRHHQMPSRPMRRAIESDFRARLRE